MIFRATEMWKIATFNIFQVLFCPFGSSKNLALIACENAVGQHLWKDSMFLLKQEHLWSFHPFSKIRKQKKILQILTKYSEGFFIFRRSFTRVTELYHSLNINKLSHKLPKALYNLLIWGMFMKIWKSRAHMA